MARDSTLATVPDPADALVILLDSAVGDAFQRAASLSHRAGVVFVAAPDDDCWSLLALESGARGVVVQSATVSQLTHAIHTVADGFIWARRNVLSTWIDYLTHRSCGEHGALEDRLSAREREVLRQTVAGLANKEVAERLAITEATVKVHLTHIFRKLGVHGRAQLAAAYHGLGFATFA